MTQQNLAIVIVAYGNESALPELLSRIVLEKGKGDYLVLVDNHPHHNSATVAEGIPGVDIILRSKNIGFGAGCNLGVAALPGKVSTLLFLNPDVLPEKYAITKLRRGAPAQWDAWMGLLTLPDGTINSSGNVVHLSGLSWCSHYGLPKASVTRPKAVSMLSGACLMIKKPVWDKVGGFDEDYFMYYEDTDLSMTLHERGYRVGVVPAAVFVHDYTYEKGQLKWFYLERNRYIFICRHWPAATFFMLLPLLLVAEIGFWAAAATQGRFVVRTRAVLSFLKIFPHVLSTRWPVQRRRRITNRQFLQYLQPALDTPLLGSAGASRTINRVFTLYYRVVIFLVRKLSVTVP
jgi:GT2 family glycosyltransferase